MAQEAASGKRFGPYTIYGELARGGQGAIYRATDANDAPCALKMLTSRDPQAAARFRQEGKVLAALSHPGGTCSVVMRSVVEELQRIADSSDKNRRGRGRRGLEILRELQALPGVDVELPRTMLPGEVDASGWLRERAVRYPQRIKTIEFLKSTEL